MAHRFRQGNRPMRSFPIVGSGRPQRSATTSRGRGASNPRTRSNTLLDEDPKFAASTNTFVAGARITRDQVVVTAPAWPPVATDADHRRSGAVKPNPVYIVTYCGQ